MGFSVKDPIRGSITGNAGTVNNHTVEKDVPADAKFTDTTYESKAAASEGTAVSLVTTGEKYTWNNKASSDTKNTAGSTNSISKIYLIGATEQGANPQTYSNNAVYATNGKLTASQIETGSDAANYFQSQKFRGEGSASTYYHAVDFGYSGHNQVDFYEYGGIYNFHKHTAAAVGEGDTLLGKITTNGWEGNVKGILTGSLADGVTAATQSSGDNSTKVATTAYVDKAIEDLPEPMIFKGSLGTGGTITALPIDGTATVGDTYKVITAGTYASKTAKVGDTFICLTKTSSANTWELIPSGDEPSGTVTSVKIQATSPIAIDSDTAITTSGTRTISHADSGVTAGTYNSVTVNATGHVTAGTNPTTLSGYGITDAKISNGTITLGKNKITPLTSYTEINNNLVNGSATESLRVISASSTIGDYSCAMGYGAKASGQFSYAEGRGSIASGEVSHTEGHQTEAGGKYAHSENYKTSANGNASHAEGDGTAATTYAQHVQGTWNIIETGTDADTKGVNAVILGNGTDSSHRHNAHTIDWSGNAWFAGDVYVGGSSKDSGSEKLLTASDVTDTKNTAGSTDTSSKIFLIGATSQAANPQTYSDNEIYATSGVLTTKSVQVGGTAATIQYNSTDKCIEFIFA